MAAGVTEKVSGGKVMADLLSMVEHAERVEEELIAAVRKLSDREQAELLERVKRELKNQ